MSCSLTIEVHLAHGVIQRFDQDDPDVAATSLSNIPAPDRFFTQPTFVIHGPGALAVFRSASVARIDLIADNCPKWPFLQQAESVREVDDEEFDLRYDPEEYARRRLAEVSGGVPSHQGYTRIHLSTGEHVTWEVKSPARTGTVLDIMPRAAMLLNSGGLYATRKDRGVMIINPHHIASLVFFPGPPEVPARAIHANLVGVFSEDLKQA